MTPPEENYYTMADVLTWDGQERWELIDGTPLMMAPPVRIHQKIVSEINRQLGNYLKGKNARSTLLPSLFACLSRTAILQKM